MLARMEAVFFTLTAFLISAQILGAFASLAFPELATTDAGHQLQVRGVTACPAPVTAKVQAMQAEQTSKS